MGGRKAFLLRLDPALHRALEAWAADDLRSLNGQIEFLLREALRRAGRPTRPAAGDPDDDATDPPGPMPPGAGR